MTVGRPSKYTQEIIDAARGYLENFEEVGDAIPSLAGLGVELKLNRSTIHAWDKDEGKEEFSNILEEIRQTQERILIAKGLRGEFNSNIVKLALGKHGYHDKVDNTQAGPGGKPIQTETHYRVSFVEPGDIDDATDS